ncbi:hypothetical protein CKA32_001698 [Geitlerinema sp. FC II]|nr:hypothetical protein CKA32_001698 [Geitlerinema sp. FC II]
MSSPSIAEKPRISQLNLDIKAAVAREATTALEHFSTFGLKENRRFSLAFDAENSNTTESQEIRG